MPNSQLSADQETVAFDVEGTLTTGTAWEAMRDELQLAGQGGDYAAFRRRMLPRYLLYRLNLTDRQAFKQDWVAGLLAFFAGRTAGDIATLGRQIVETRLWPARREDVLGELDAHRAHGRQIVLVSGQFQPFLDAFVARCGADLGIGSAGIWRDGRFSGQIARPFTIGQRKVDLLTVALNGSPLVAAYGDTAADAAMLAASERPVAVYPEQRLRQMAVERGWRVMG